MNTTHETPDTKGTTMSSGDIGYRSDISYHDLRRVTEHGQDWYTCAKCGAQWAIEDSNLGEVCEQVTDGDGYCDQVQR